MHVLCPPRKITTDQVDAQVDQQTHYTFYTGVPRADAESGKVTYTVMPDGEVVWPK